MAEGNGVATAPKVPDFEVHIRWSPSTGQVQVAATEMDAVLQLGMLEMAKMAMQESRTRQASSPLVVPGRFAS